MNEEERNDLIAAVWAALDATDGDSDTVQAEIDQAIHAWSPDEDDEDQP